jgi:hypothetical protein
MADTSSDTGRLERIVLALGEVGLEAVPPWKPAPKRCLPIPARGQ